MKAIICKEYGGPEVMEIGEYETPVPSKSEVLIKVYATALNRADTMQRKGKYPPPAGASPILGLETAGEVVACGTEVNKFKIGDKVCSLLTGGGYAEFVTVHQDLLFSVPETMPMTQAAGLPEVFMTAYQALVYLGDLQKGETILVHAGASGVGLAAIQIAKHLGATVIVTASKGKHGLCKEIGADHCIDYKSERFDEVVMELTNQKGAQMILDFLAAPYFQQNINSLDFDGRLVMLATMGGVKVEQLNLLNIIRKRLRIMGSTLRARSLAYKTQLRKDLEGQFWSEFENGQFKVVVDSVFDWSEVAEAHQRMEQNLNAGKIILKVQK